MGRHRCYYRGHIPKPVYQAVTNLINYCYTNTMPNQALADRVSEVLKKVEPCTRIRDIMIDDICANRGYVRSDCQGFCGRVNYGLRKRTIIYETAKALGFFE